MIREFRKRHLYTWLVLVLLLPIGFFAAFFAIPEEKIEDQKVQYIDQTVIGPVIAEAKSELETVEVKLRSSKDGLQKQLEIEVKVPITSPSAFIYVASDKGENISTAQIVGTLKSKGTHFVTLDSILSAQAIEQVLIYDKIKDQLLFTADF